TIGADHPSVGALEDLGRVRRVNYDRVLVRVDVVRSPKACEPWRYRAEGFFKGRAEAAPAGRRVLHVIGKVGEGAGGGSAAGGRNGLGIARCRRAQHGAPV